MAAVDEAAFAEMPAEVQEKGGLFVSPESFHQLHCLVGLAFPSFMPISVIGEEEESAAGGRGTGAASPLYRKGEGKGDMLMQDC